MRYCPVLSLMVVRTFSMSAGLVASTVTPGRTAPEVSLTEPAITACAKTPVGTRTIDARITNACRVERMIHLAMGFPWKGWHTLLPQVVANQERCQGV